MALQPYDCVQRDEDGDPETIGAVIVCTTTNQPLVINPKHFTDADDAEEFLQWLVRQNVDARELQPENLRAVAFEWEQLDSCDRCDRRVPPDAIRDDRCLHCWSEQDEMERQGELADELADELVAEIAMERGV